MKLLLSIYLFQSKRLGFRNWRKSDLPTLIEMNSDPKVMEHFPAPLSKHESEELFQRMQDHFEKHQHTYFATEVLDTGELIGFIGLAYQEYESPFTPAVDIGWRLIKSAWGNGYATEGAKRCIEYGFQDLGIKQIISTCTLKNTKSERVMQKIGMQKLGEFKHPRLKAYSAIEECLCYGFNIQ